MMDFGTINSFHAMINLTLEGDHFSMCMRSIGIVTYYVLHSLGVCFQSSSESNPDLIAAIVQPLEEITVH